MGISEAGLIVIISDLHCPGQAVAPRFAIIQIPGWRFNEQQ